MLQGYKVLSPWILQTLKICQVLPDIFEDTCGMSSSEDSHLYLAKFLLQKSVKNECWVNKLQLKSCTKKISD